MPCTLPSIPSTNNLYIHLDCSSMGKLKTHDIIFSVIICTWRWLSYSLNEEQWIGLHVIAICWLSNTVIKENNHYFHGSCFIKLQDLNQIIQGLRTGKCNGPVDISPSTQAAVCLCLPFITSLSHIRIIRQAPWFSAVTRSASFYCQLNHQATECTVWWNEWNRSKTAYFSIHA